MTAAEEAEWDRIQDILDRAQNEIEKGCLLPKLSIHLLGLIYIGRGAAALATLHRIGRDGYHDLDRAIEVYQGHVERAARETLDDLTGDLPPEPFDFRTMLQEEPRSPGR